MLLAENITVYYGKIMALRGVTVEVREGEVVAIIGRNGAGKTTLIKTVMGLVRPVEGRIVFRGQDITRLPPWKRAELGIGYVPEGRRLFPYLTVEENLVVGAYLVKSREELEKRLQEVYQMFPRLRERRKQLAKSLSGGEAQMLAIARGLMNNPRLLLMDEPSQGLAPIVVEELFEKIKELKREGYSLLLVEQNARKALEVADRVYVLETGQIKYHGSAEEARRDPAIRKAYLGA